MLTVTGILAATAIPVLRYSGAVRSSSAANQLVSHLRYAQLQAMATYRTTWVVFDVNNDSYSVWIEDPSNPGKAGRVALVDPLSRDSLEVQLDAAPWSGVRITAASFNSTAEVEYDSFGEPRDASSTALSTVGTVTLNDGSTIEVAPQTGAVEIGP